MAKTLFEHVEPRRDVLDGVLSDSVFAASLDEVVAGTAPDTYGDATSFFNGTYPRLGCGRCSTRYSAVSAVVARTARRWSGWRPIWAAGRPTISLPFITPLGAFPGS